MPVCVKCEVMKASSEMRRLRKDAAQEGWQCRDKETCKQRRKDKRAHHQAN